MNPLMYCMDPLPRPAAMQMALDEVIMRSAFHPVLRKYQWAEPSASIGYFTPAADADALMGMRDVVRRYTGGGLVDHLNDWTFSLTLPATVIQQQRCQTKEWYCRIHLAMRDALRIVCGQQVHLKTDTAPGSIGPCFISPVEYDGMLDGRKIFGGAIRKSRLGLLYQGSLQGIDAPEHLLTAVAEHLQLGDLMEYASDDFPISEAQSLSASRYANPAWLERC